MEPELVNRLINLNQEFYDRFAESFAETRSSPQPGFYSLLNHLPEKSKDILDVGCGDARFIRFLMTYVEAGHYTGVDFSSPLLKLARNSTDAIFIEIDLNKPGCLDQLDSFDVISCLATLQHLPGHKNRARLLREISQHMRIGGRNITL